MTIANGVDLVTSTRLCVRDQNKTLTFTIKTIYWMLRCHITADMDRGVILIRFSDTTHPLYMFTQDQRADYKNTYPVQKV